MLCKDCKSNSLYVLNKFQGLLQKCLQVSPSVSNILLFAVLAKNNREFHRNIEAISELLETFFCEKVIDYCRVPKNQPALYFLLMALENLVV